MPPTATCPIVVALFFGLKAAVLAIVLEAVVRIGKRSLKNNVDASCSPRPPSSASSSSTSVSHHHFRRGAHRLSRRRGAASPAFQAEQRPRRRQEGRRAVVDSLLGDELPEHARPTVARALRASRIWLALWLIPVIALARHAGQRQRLQRRSPSSSARWRW